MASKSKSKNSKNSRNSKNPQPRKTAEEHKRKSTQIIFLAVSVIIILAMVLSMIRF